VGTPLYWAPEQVPPAHRPSAAAPAPAIDHRTDVWGLGVTLYELLTLRRPFSKVEQILTEPPNLPNKSAGSLPRELRAVCLMALEKDPSGRYATALAMADDLRCWLDLRPTAAGDAAIRRTSNRILGRIWIGLRRLGFWSRRRPAAACLVMALLVIGGLGVAYGAQVSQVKLQKALVETETTKAELQQSEHNAELTKAQLEAAQREQSMLELPRLRKPIRRQGWFQDSWQHLRTLRGGSTSADPQLQSHAAATLEGIDAHAEKLLPGGAGALAFDSSSDRLLNVRSGIDRQGRSWSTILWERSTQRTLVERDLGDGVPAFRPDGTPIQLSRDRNDRGRLVLYDVKSGKEMRSFRSPISVPSALPELTLSGDGSRLAAVACRTNREADKLVPERDGNTSIAVWDAASDQPIKILEHKATQDLVLSPDGGLLAAWDDTGEITVWTLPDGKRSSLFRVGRCPVACIAFGCDPMWRQGPSAPSWLLAVAESSGLVTIWDLVQNRPRSFCRGSEFSVWAMDFSPDGALLLTAGRHPTGLWDVTTGACVLHLREGDFAQSVSFARDGRHCAFSFANLSSGEPGAKFVELELGNGIRTLYGLRGVVERTTSSPDGRLIAAVTHEWDIGVWERDSGRLLGVLPGPIGRVADSIALAFDPHGRRITCSVGHEARLWDLEKRRMIGQWLLPEGLCDSIAFSGDGRLYLVRQENKSREGGPFPNLFPSDKFPRTVRLYDLLSSTPTQPLVEIDDFDWHIHGIRIAPDGSVFAVDGIQSGREKKRRIFKVYTCQSRREVGSLPTSLRLDRPSWFFFDWTSKILAVPLIEDSASVSLFSLPDLGYRGVTKAAVACLSPGAKWAMNYTPEQPYGLALYDVPTGLPVMRMVLDVDAMQLSFNLSPDDRYATVGHKDGTVSVLDLVEINKQLTKLNLGW
jgi:WD40 repeat protein